MLNIRDLTGKVDGTICKYLVILAQLLTYTQIWIFDNSLKLDEFMSMI